MSVNIVNKTTGDLTRVAGNATDKVGNLNALTTTDKTSIVGGVNEINGKVKDVSNTLADYASLDIYISNSQFLSSLFRQTSKKAIGFDNLSLLTPRQIHSPMIKLSQQ